MIINPETPQQLIYYLDVYFFSCFHVFAVKNPPRNVARDFSLSVYKTKLRLIKIINAMLDPNTVQRTQSGPPKR